MKKLLILLLLADSASFFAQDIHFVKVDGPKETPFGSVLGFTQDRVGYNWIATSVGLYRYDVEQHIYYRDQPI